MATVNATNEEANSPAVNSANITTYFSSLEAHKSTIEATHSPAVNPANQEAHNQSVRAAEL